MFRTSIRESCCFEPGDYENGETPIPEGNGFLEAGGKTISICGDLEHASMRFQIRTNCVSLLGMIDSASPRYLAFFWQFAIAWVAIGLMCFALVVGSIATSPTFDEPAHFASGVVLARNADAGYFKVNPPANKWITAGSSFIAPALEMPNAAASSVTQWHDPRTDKSIHH